MPTLTWDTRIKPFGVPLKIHATALVWPLLFANAGWAAFPMAIAILLFVAVHEYAHVWAARKLDIPVRSVVMHGFGGAAMAEGKWREIPPLHEAKVAIAGPVASAILGIFFLASAVAVKGFGGSNAAMWPFGWSALINIILFIFNMIPIFPMDGGRILRSILHSRLGMDRATKVAMYFGIGVGAVVAFLLAWHGMVWATVIVVAVVALGWVEGTVELRGGR